MQVVLTMELYSKSVVPQPFKSECIQCMHWIINEYFFPYDLDTLN